MKKTTKEQRSDIFDSLIPKLKKIEEKLRQGEDVLNFSLVEYSQVKILLWNCQIHSRIYGHSDIRLAPQFYNGVSCYNSCSLEQFKQLEKEIFTLELQTLPQLT